MMSLVNVGVKWRYVKLGFQLAVSGAVIVLALLVFIYPAVTIGILVCDSELRQTGQSRLVPGWFNSAAGRYLSPWANEYLKTNYAASLHHDEIAPTEWPMFGSAFFLVTADDLQQQGKIDARAGVVRQAVEKAAQIVASPVTATWVRTKWGDTYLTPGERVLPDVAHPGPVVLREDHGQWAASRTDVHSAAYAGRRVAQSEVPFAQRLSQRVLSGRHAVGGRSNSASRAPGKCPSRRPGPQADDGRSTDR